MVVFTCNNCGDSLQKPRVAKHLQFSCRKPASLTCVDCLKDFRRDEYVAHTKCITEAERYGGKNYVPKPGANKGEQKQQQWLNIVSNLLNSSVASLSPLERSLLERISKFENVPRKKVKFLNFINTLGQRVNKAVVESVWAKMEAAQIKPAQNGVKSSESLKIEELSNNENPRNSINEDRRESNIAENENNENISRESKGDGHQNRNKKMDNNENGSMPDIKSAKKKKSRKRELSESSRDVDDESSPKKVPVILPNDNIESTKQSTCANVTKKPAFDWKNAICTIVSAKQEIPLHKLQKKIVAQYMNYCSKDMSHEKAVSRFNKKLKKISDVVIADEKVTLA